MPKHSWESDFSEYVVTRTPKLRGLAYALCGDWHTADDLIQVTFLRLYRRWSHIRSETVDAYARRTLVNAFLTGRRSAQREVAMAELPERAAAVADGTDGIDIGPALAALPPRQRAIVVLRFLEDLSVADVAGLLGISEGTVTSQTARGLRAIRDAIGEPSERRELRSG